MTLPATVAELVGEFKTNGRIVIVGASQAGLRAAEARREEGYPGYLTVIGDEPYEPYEPYDRPPLSKHVLKGWVSADHTTLPRMREVERTGGSGWLPPDWTGPSSRCSWPTASRSRTTGC